MRKTLLLCSTALALVVGLTGTASGGDGEHGRHLTVLPQDCEWQPVGSMPPGATAAVLEGNPSEPGDFTMRIKFPPDYDIPVHVHPQTERVTVLEGTLYLAVGETFDRERVPALPEGALKVMDAGVPMYGFTKDEPAVIQLNGRGPWGIQYLDPEDDPRR